MITFVINPRSLIRKKGRCFVEALARKIGFLPLEQNKEAAPIIAYCEGTSLPGNRTLVEDLLSRWEQARPFPEEFREVHGRKAVSEMMRNYHRIIQTFENEKRSRHSRVAEIIFAEAIQYHHWLGAHVRVLPVTNYDDVRNHVDFIIVVDGDDGRVSYLGVDITISDQDKVGDKRAKYFGYLRDGYLRSVKFLKDHVLGWKGELDIPAIFLHVDTVSVNFLVNALLGVQNLSSFDKMKLLVLRSEFVAIVKKEIEDHLRYVDAMIEAERMSPPHKGLSPRCSSGMIKNKYLRIQEGMKI